MGQTPHCMCFKVAAQTDFEDKTILQTLRLVPYLNSQAMSTMRNIIKEAFSHHILCNCLNIYE